MFNLNVAHSHEPTPGTENQSGVYEGNELVVDTSGRHQELHRQFRTPHGPKLHVEGVSGIIGLAARLREEITVEDPDTLLKAVHLPIVATEESTSRCRGLLRGIRAAIISRRCGADPESKTRVLSDPPDERSIHVRLSQIEASMRAAGRRSDLCGVAFKRGRPDFR